MVAAQVCGGVSLAPIKLQRLYFVDMINFDQCIRNRPTQ